VQFEDPTYSGGANTVSLTDARKNFRRIGAISPEAVALVRPPLDIEVPKMDAR
jgi:hypothetical protein